MIYLVWERDSYCDYDVVLVTSDKEKAINFVNENNRDEDDERFWFEERELELATLGQW